MNWLVNNWDTILQATWAHVRIAAPAIAFSLILSIPLGWLAQRFRTIRFPVVAGTSLLYAIPSLPLLIIIPVITGLGPRSEANVIIALTLYGIALLVRTVVDSLEAVPADTVLASTAMGYSPARRFFTVQLPLAGPGVLAGLRVVSASTVALVTVSAVLGVHSLGMLFTDGFQRGIVAEVLTGILGTILIAIVFDRLLVWGSLLVMPWTRSRP